jgi:aryl-alcohol dehydrogenase-like predicted oxidoreductase
MDTTLECSGLIYAGTGENGVVTYTVAPLAERPVSELARMQGWEREYVSNLRAFKRQQTNNLPESPLARDLLKVEPSSIRYFTKEEITELDRRIERALNRVSSLHALKLKWLRAECERHLSNFVTADDLYRDSTKPLRGS